MEPLQACSLGQITHNKPPCHYCVPPAFAYSLQAIEAKEGLEIQNESVTLASISYQVRLELL